ncbi:MAG: PIG-L family deacetylase [Candidatus Thiodiazotropha sp.]|jgi:N-acetylglucosamine malate deacetylase 1
MLGEVDLVPYQAGELPSGPYLVFAPHADDETFGLGGLLLKASERNIKFDIAIMTDGALGGTIRPDIVELRKQEALRASRFLGAASVHFFDYPDRGLKIDPESIATIREHIEGLRPAAIFFPSLLEYHPDHRATAMIVAKATETLCYETWSAYAYDISAQGFVNRLIDISPVKEKKLQAMSIYLSQQEVHEYSDLVLALNRTRAYTLPAGVDYAEGLYEFTRDELKDLCGFLSGRALRYC